MEPDFIFLDVKTILKSFAAKSIHITVTWMVVTPDKSSSNQRLAKKTRAKGEILSDENLIWLDAHLVTIQDPWSWVVFVIDPTRDYRIADVWLPKVSLPNLAPSLSITNIPSLISNTSPQIRIYSLKTLQSVFE